MKTKIKPLLTALKNLKRINGRHSYPIGIATAKITQKGVIQNNTEQKHFFPLQWETETGQTFEVCINIAECIKSLKKIKGVVSVKLSDNKQKVIFECESGYKYTLDNFKGELELHTFPSTEGKHQVFDSQKLLVALKRLYPTMSRDDSRSYICGIYFDCIKKAVRMVSTDGYCLSRFDFVKNTEIKPFLLPLAMVKSLIQSLKSKNIAADLHFYQTEHKVTFQNLDFCIETKTENITYPNYKSMIEGSETINAEATALSLDLMKVCEGTLSDGSWDKKKLMDMEVNGTLKIKTAQIEKVIQNAQVSGKEKAHFNGGYLESILKPLGNKNIKLNILFPSDQRPIKIHIGDKQISIISRIKT